MTLAPLIRILHAEDDADTRKVAALSLRDLGGFDLKECTNGREAVDAAPTFRPDLVLLDVIMPVMSGPEALKRLRKSAITAHIPILFMTGRFCSTEVAVYRRLGAASVIAKPFDPCALPKIIREVWQGHCERLAGGKPPRDD